jgi:hypothetical protein
MADEGVTGGMEKKLFSMGTKMGKQLSNKLVCV